jgi:hypothetical protein
MDIQPGTGPLYFFIAGTSMFLLGLCLTFLRQRRRQPKRFDVWEFAIAPLVILAVLIWGYLAIDLDRDDTFIMMIFISILLFIGSVPFGPLAWIAMGLLIFLTLRNGTASLDLIGGACTGLLGGGVAGYLTAVFWRSIPPGPE